MSRGDRHLREPGQDLTGFPRLTLSAGEQVYRCHTTTNGPWWFASRPEDDSGGRFDLEAPAGTCYVGMDAQTAVLERFGPEIHGQGFVFEESAERARVSALELAEDVEVADTADRKAAGWLTRELSSGNDYALCQRWAAEFYDHGFTGIRYQSRFAMGHDQFAVALLGDAGPRPWPKGPAASVIPKLEAAGIRVVRPLRLSALTKAKRPTGPRR